MRKNKFSCVIKNIIAAKVPWSLRLKDWNIRWLKLDFKPKIETITAFFIHPPPPPLHFPSPPQKNYFSFLTPYFLLCYSSPSSLFEILKTSADLKRLLPERNIFCPFEMIIKDIIIWFWKSEKILFGSFLPSLYIFDARKLVGWRNHFIVETVNFAGYNIKSCFRFELKLLHISVFL